MEPPVYRYTALFTDFGIGSPYVGQLHALLADALPGNPVVDLLNDAPAFSPRPAAYLLNALYARMPAGGACLAVVDPGVGSERRALLMETDRGLFVGPDNGLLARVGRLGRGPKSVWEIPLPGEGVSDSFHGRDVFLPALMTWCRGGGKDWSPVPPKGLVGWDWPDDLFEIIYVDTFGNLMTGIEAASVPEHAVFDVGGVPLRYARTFSEVEAGAAFWYRNSMGLVEFAVNQGRADVVLGAEVGAVVSRAG